jgi:2-succinyl-6-hydroxy-2,4-cyclohexadiene-1-carboxylate synthase
MDFEHEEHFETRQVDANGVHVVWDEEGEGGRPFVLVHGFTGSRKDFAPSLPDLADLGRTLAPALRGHADGYHAHDPAAYTLEAAAADLVAWLDALGLDRVDLLGHSMGGFVAERIALEHPERVASLVLMDTAGRAMRWMDADLFEVGGRIAVERGVAALHEILRERAADDPTRTAADRRREAQWGPERFWAWRRERFVGMDPHAVAPFGRAIAEHPDWLERLGAIRCPTLVLVGEEDGPFLECAEELVRAIPGAEHAVIPEAGHQPQVENPGPWTRALRDHLERARG